MLTTPDQKSSTASFGGGPGSACSHIEVAATPMIVATNNRGSSSSSNRTTADNDTTADRDTTSAAALSKTITNGNVALLTGKKNDSIRTGNSRRENNNTTPTSLSRGGSGDEKFTIDVTTTTTTPTTTPMTISSSTNNKQGRPKRTTAASSSASPQKDETTNEKIMTPPISLTKQHKRSTIANNNNNDDDDGNNQLTTNHTMTVAAATSTNDNIPPSSPAEEDTSSSSLFHLLLETTDMKGGGKGGGGGPSSSSSRQYFLWVSWDFICEKKDCSDRNYDRGGGLLLRGAQVGDLMCIMDTTTFNSSSLVHHHHHHHHHTTTPLPTATSATTTTNINESSNHEPFNIPWRPCQILSIFRDERMPNNKLSSKRKKQYGPLLVEIRWFYRKSDIDNTTASSSSSSSSTTRGNQYTRNKNRKKRMRDDVDVHHDNDNNNDDDDEVFETSHVVVLPASFLLGELNLRTTIERKACNFDDNDDSRMQQTLGPVAMASCRRFYFHQGHEIVNIRLNDIVGGEKKNKFVSRGLECSEILQNDCILKENTYTSLGYDTPPITRDKKVAMKVDLPSPILTTSSTFYYASCSLAHPLTQLIHGNLLHPTIMTPTSSFPIWEVCVGDIVAVHCDESTPPEYSKSWYPYIVPWSHCQVMSIFKEGDDNNDDDDDDVSRFSGGGGSMSSSKKQTPKKKTKQTSYANASSTMMSSSSVDAALVKVEVRWFPRVSEAILEVKGRERELKSLKELSNNDTTPVEVILEGRQISIIDCISLLGPVSIVDIDGCTRVHTTPAPAYLPQNRRIICTTMTCDESGKPRFSNRLSNTTDPITRVERGINESLRYDKSQMKKVIDAVKLVRNERLHRTTTDLHHETLDIAIQPSTGLDDSSHGKRNLVEKEHSIRSRKKVKSTTNDSSVVVVNTPIGMTETLARSDRAVRNDRENNEVLSSTLRVSCNTDPYHVDVSALKSFYNDIDIILPVDSYDTRFTCVVSGDMEKHDNNWKVKLGDTVAVEIEQDTKVLSSTYFPFTVQWAPGEVVTIYRLHKTKASCALLRERDPPERNDPRAKSVVLQEANDSEIMIEIRWLYRIWEIPGASKKKVNTVDGELEEVFETDQLVVCSADSILSPVHLYETAATSTHAKNILGMPNIHYHCSRFWSIHRRSFVPSGSLSSRISRGRMHSAYKAAFSKLESGSSDKIVEPSSNTSWKEEFQTAIQKLSLAEAAHDAQENGMVLSCRENERAQIITFVRKAISGLAQSNKFDGGVDDEVKNLKSSLFIAGPPGTGKVRWVSSMSYVVLSYDSHRVEYMYCTSSHFP